MIFKKTDKLLYLISSGYMVVDRDCFKISKVLYLSTLKRWAIAVKIFQEVLENCHQTDFESSAVKKEKIKHIDSKMDDFIGGYSNKAQAHIIYMNDFIAMS